MPKTPSEPHRRRGRSQKRVTPYPSLDLPAGGLVIDGSAGEGGGQILRTSLSMSLVTGRAFRIERIRAKRKRPGLMRQHLTAVRAAADTCGARIAGDEMGSQTLTFLPGPVTPGRFHFAVGTAGSSTLVLQTVLPALAVGREPSLLILEGGTHNTHAPPFDFLEQTFLPLLSRMGARVEAHLDRRGFYPAGGGRFTAVVHPCSALDRLDLMERGEIRKRSARALISQLPANIGERQIAVVGRDLSWRTDEADEAIEANETNEANEADEANEANEANVANELSEATTVDCSLQVETVENSPGPGNVVLITLGSDAVTEIFAGFGERGVKAEQVAAQAAQQALDYLSADVPVGRHLADQLLVPMAIAGGGRFRTLPPTLHTQTNIEVLKHFVDIDVQITEESAQTCIIEMNGPALRP